MNLQIQATFHLSFRVAVVAGLGFCGAAMAQMRPETIASGLENPWGVSFLPGGRFVVTERPGRLLQIVDLLEFFRFGRIKNVTVDLYVP